MDGNFGNYFVFVLSIVFFFIFLVLLVYGLIKIVRKYSFRKNLEDNINKIDNLFGRGMDDKDFIEWHKSVKRLLIDYLGKESDFVKDFLKIKFCLGFAAGKYNTDLSRKGCIGHSNRDIDCFNNGLAESKVLLNTILNKVKGWL
ncbi:MAG: hypothetical protein JXA91_02570 [Candidatus Thermoplasmatota archaeon]|nr:hypothetical protein [Candidatus Thermoplasmatota archaeon]